MDTLEALQDLVARHATGSRCPTALPGLTLFRSDAVSPCSVQTIYAPMLCVIVQGRKRVVVGDTPLEYAAADSLVTSVHLPVSGNITEATPDCPYLALSLDLDLTALAGFLLELAPELSPKPSPKLSPARPGEQPFRAIAVRHGSPDMLEALVRLLRLLDRPAEIAPLAPLLVREIQFRLLTGDHAPMLRQITLAGSRTAQVVRAIDWIRQNFARPLHIATLARIAGMSPASLYRHFKAVTTMSPLQYQKQLRLQEARHLLVSRGDDAATAGFTVGYGSPSQFSREYHRLFGAPPRQDLDRRRATSATLTAI